MPKAIVDINDTQKFDLKTCPGGWVVLRRMTYGQWLQRNEQSLLMQAQRGKGKGNEQVDMQIQSKKVALFEYKHCMVEHNLESDDNGTLLDFTNPVTLEILDPRIGNEIGAYITDMNDFSDDDAGN
jgi:hypothetical protein